VVHIQAAMPGTYSADHAWYIYGRSHLVHIQAAMPGTHSADHAWYILARSMTNSSQWVATNKLIRFTYAMITRMRPEFWF